MTVPTGKITSIFFETDRGTFVKLADNIDNEKLLKLCGKADRQERLGTWEVFVKQHRNAMLIRSAETDHNSAVKLVEWMINYDLDAPIEEQFITTKLIGSEDFVEIISLYYSVGSINVTREYRGQSLRDDIFHYVNAAPLSANEFIMIYECCAFDQGLITKMLNNFAYACTKGGKLAYPADQKDEIEAYCKEAGIWEDMMSRVEFQKKRDEDNKAAQREWIIKENITENEKTKKGLRFENGRVVHQDGLPGQQSKPGRGGRGGSGKGRGGARSARGGGKVDA